MNIPKAQILYLLILLITGIEVQAQSKISFGDNPQTVLSLVKYSTNQINSSQSEVSAQYKPIYENGTLVEIIFVKKNVSNLYGTLTQYFTARSRYIFSKNQLSKILVEIPEKSVAEVKKAISNSNQFNFIDKYIFSEDYESVYSVYLNSNKITTVQSLPTLFQSFPPNVKMQIDSIYKEKLIKEETKRVENEQYEQKRKLEVEEEAKNPKYMVAVTKQAEYIGGETALNKYISQNIEVPNDLDWSGRLVVQFIIEKDGSVNDVEVKGNCPSYFKNSIINTFKKMPKWKPAQTSEGTSVRSQKQIPLQF